MWLDKTCTEQILKLLDKFNVHIFVETGTAHGINARFWGTILEGKNVMFHSCDIDLKMIEIAQRKIEDIPSQSSRMCRRVFLYGLSSPDFLRGCEKQPTLFFLDAHWYDYWPLLDELKALKGFTNCCIVIHDFKVPGLGYVSYKGQDLDWEYVREDLMAVNPGFFLYVNRRGHIYSKAEVAEGQVKGIVLDKDTETAMDYAWSETMKTHRGILYAVPGRLDSSFSLDEVTDENGRLMLRHVRQR